MSEYANYDDYNDPYEENEYDAVRGKKITVGKIIGKTFVYSLRILAVAVFAILFWRIFSGGDPKSMQEFIWTESTVEAYNKAPDKFNVYYYKHKDNLSEGGKFSASNVYYVAENGQFQITLRYNNSTVKKLMEDYNLSEEPNGEAFVFVLKDHLGNTYTEYEYFSDKKNVYNYRRLVFDGVDMGPLTVRDPLPESDEEEIERIESAKKEVLLTLNVYYKDDVLLSEPYGKLAVYDYSYYHEQLEQSFITKNAPSPAKNLIERMEYTVKEEPEETTEN